VVVESVTVDLRQSNLRVLAVACAIGCRWPSAVATAAENWNQPPLV